MFCKSKIYKNKIQWGQNKNVAKVGSRTQNLYHHTGISSICKLLCKHRLRSLAKSVCQLGNSVSFDLTELFRFLTGLTVSHMVSYFANCNLT
jgi:hypothetical protein